MNKMAKGAIATAVGVILLAGGGGTLATWNQAQNSSMGSVVSGDLNLVPVSAGAWTDSAGETITNIAAYKVVPGETLTYTQQLDVTLSGDLMAATLKVTGDTANNGFDANAVVSTTALKNAANGAVLPATTLHAADTGTVTATTTFAFKESTANRDSVNSNYDFSAIGYELTQLAPAGSNGL
ncbi:alternate-type signal peptide domain-containing protein [Arthrobacter sp. HLT1-20]